MDTIAGRPVISIMFGEWPMWILMILSVFAITLVVERMLYFRRNNFNVARGYAQIRKLLAEGRQAEALQYADTQKNPMGRLFRLVLNNLHLSADEVSDLIYSFILEEKLLFERFLGGIGTMANVATLVGLLGTVWGLIKAFNDVFKSSGSGGAKVVAGGIAVALLATLFGLFVGILSLAFFNYFNKKASDQAGALESLSEKLMVIVGRMKDKAGVPHEPEVAARPQPQPKPAVKVQPSDDEAAWRF